MHLLLCLEQSRPELLLELLLSQDHLDTSWCVVGLAVLDVDLFVEFQLDMIRRLLRLAVPGILQAIGFEIKLQRVLGDVGSHDGHENDILDRVGLG